MNLMQIYRGSLIVSGVFFLMYWFAPYAYGTLNQETQIILAYGGTGAWFNFPEWIYWWFLIFTIAAYIGMFQFRKAFLWLFIIMFIVGLILASASGVSIITGIEVFIIDTSTALIGFIIALAFFSPLKERFY